MKKSLLLLLISLSLSAHAYKVFVHVGHDFTAKELLKSKGWNEVANRADGVWVFDAWIRTLTKKSNQNKVLNNIKTREFAIAEFHWSPAFIGKNRQKPNPVIDAPERAGFSNIWCMVYNEKNYGSTLSPEEIKNFRKNYPEYKLITNFRVFNPKRFKNELKLLDGISYEFSAENYNKKSQHHPNQTKIENVAEAVKWCLDHNKKIFLLIPPGNNKPAKNNRFVNNFNDLIHSLAKLIGNKYIMNDNLIIVPATYDCRKRKVHNTPEKINGKYANTGMGATLIALNFRNEIKLRDLTLLPIPKQMVFSDGVFRFKNAAEIRKHISIKIDVNKMLENQGYILHVSTNKIKITAHDNQGAFYAKMTLQQIIRQCLKRETIPCLVIYDYPDLLNRGVMLDISRDKVPTMKSLKNFIRILAEWKINQFQLYTEHTFAYTNHQDVWKNYSPMTAKQIQELDLYCKKRFIDLVPNQNSFGHLERWLGYKEYNDMAEVPSYPSALNPVNPRSIKFIEELYDELLTNFSSKLFNVGCDETWQLGTGGSSNAVAELGKEQVYYNFLMKIYNLTQKHNKTMMFWADMLYSHPEYFKKLPTNSIALVWGYIAGQLGKPTISKFGKAGCRFYVCPSTCTFNSHFGRTSNMIQNVRDAVENGRKFGTEGLLMTIWGDQGNWQQLPFEYPGIAYAAAASWNYKGNKNIDIPLSLDKNLFMDSSNIVGKVICELGESYLLPGKQIGFLPVISRILYNPDFSITDEKWINSNSVNSLKKTINKINDLTSQLSNSNMQCDDADEIIAEINLGAKLANHGYKLAIIRLETKAKTVKEIPKKYREKLADELQKIIPEYKKIWLKRNRKGGLNDSVTKLNNFLSSYLSTSD